MRCAPDRHNVRPIAERAPARPPNCRYSNQSQLAQPARMERDEGTCPNLGFLNHLVQGRTTWFRRQTAGTKLVQTTLVQGQTPLVQGRTVVRPTLGHQIPRSPRGVPKSHFAKVFRQKFQILEKARRCAGGCGLLGLAWFTLLIVTLGTAAHQA